jgi:hypothetical protein
MKKRRALLFGLSFVMVLPVLAQEATLPAPENFIVDGVPAIPVALAESAGRYGENRSAFPADWHLQRRRTSVRSTRRDSRPCWPVCGLAKR